MGFRFKQFEVEHERCAQRVGTDGVLIGCWADVDGAKRILDVGCGCGLIALMLAQRNNEAHIVGIDIDRESIAQAKSNVANSPWNKRIEIVEQNFVTTPAMLEQQLAMRCFDSSNISSAEHEIFRFDAIVSNPPFFERSLTCPDKRRAAARHTTSLPLEILAANSSALLVENGTLSVVLPYDLSSRFICLCQNERLYLTHRCDVRGTASKPARRSLLSFTKGKVSEYHHEILTLLTPEGTRTKEHHDLTKEFYLS